MAAEKITIARIASFTKDKEGNQLTTKQGKPYTRVLIDTTDGRKMSGFGNKTTSNWNEGMEVDVEVAESNGYLNFSVPKMSESVNEMAIKMHISQEIAPLKEALKAIVAHLNIEAPQPTVGNTNIPYPQDEGYSEPTPEDSPF